MTERTFSIIKPDAVKAGNAGEILARIEKAGFRLVAVRLRHLTRSEAEGFYYVHGSGPSSGACATSCPRGPASPWCWSARTPSPRLREIMGATDPAKAAAGTIRKDFAASIEANAIHGSDAPETAAFEIGYFFPGIELVTRRSSACP